MKFPPATTVFFVRPSYAPSGLPTSQVAAESEDMDEVGTRCFDRVFVFCSWAWTTSHASSRSGVVFDDTWKISHFFPSTLPSKDRLQFQRNRTRWFWRYIFILEKTVSEACDWCDICAFSPQIVAFKIIRIPIWPQPPCIWEINHKDVWPCEHWPVPVPYKLLWLGSRMQKEKVCYKV